MKYVFIIFLSTGGWWDSNYTSFNSRNDCLDYLTWYKSEAKKDNTTIMAYCQRR